MYRLAKLGFSQSYTYFPWRNAKDEIAAYLTELAQTPVREFFRAQPVAEHARHSHRVPADWRPRGVWDSPAAGGNAGRELRNLRARIRVDGACAGAPRERGVFDSEKYEIRHWDLGSR
jgi:starch synthase (maltosyl-transferring)